MQNPDKSLTPVSEPRAPGHTPRNERERPINDKNRVDPIARSSEPGRKGEESTYVPPSSLHPERSTAQTAFDSPFTSSSGGAYGLDHFLDKGAIADATVDRSMESSAAMEQRQGESTHAVEVKHPSQVSAAAAHLAQTVKGRTSQVKDSVRRQPHVYALGAMGAGLLLGRFLRFSSR